MTSTFRHRLAGVFIVLVAISVVGTSPANAAAAADWMQFHNGPDHLGVNPAETTLSPATVGGLRQHWVSSVGENIWSSPAVVNGVVYAGGLDGRLHALSVSTGRQLWAKPDDALPGDFTFTSPAVANGLVYLGLNRGGSTLYAFDTSTGATAWADDLGFSNINGSPTVAGGVVYADTTDDQVVAVDAATGSLIWQSGPAGNSGFYTSPTVGGGLVFVTSLNGRIYALNAATGAVAWSFLAGGLNAGSAALAGGVVYFSSDDGFVYALDAATGALKWRTKYGSNITASLGSSPAISGGVLYIGTNNDGRLLALNAATGTVKWSLRTGGAVLSAPVVANGVVYVGSDDHSVYAVNATTGARLWSAALSAAVDSGPVVADGAVFAGTYGDTGGGNVYDFGR